MAKYVDGFVIVVPKGKEAQYHKMAEEGRDSWMKHGALQYFECRGDDLKPQEMGPEKSRAFAEMTGAGSDDNVWFSFIVFKGVPVENKFRTFNGASPRDGWRCPKSNFTPLGKQLSGIL